MTKRVLLPVECRRQAALTQEEVARRACVSLSTVVRAERDRQWPKRATTRRRLLGVFDLEERGGRVVAVRDGVGRATGEQP